jgi:hypothetical protein
MLDTLIPKALSAILSVVQSTSLRNRVYAMEDRLDILETAIEDIERINSNSANPNALVAGIVANVRHHNDTIKEYYAKR